METLSSKWLRFYDDNVFFVLLPRGGPCHYLSLWICMPEDSNKDMVVYLTHSFPYITVWCKNILFIYLKENF